MPAPSVKAPAPAPDAKPQPAPAPATEITAEPVLETIVRADDTLETLRARLGEKNAVTATLPGGEGETHEGWMLYPDDPARRLAVYLDDDGKRPVWVAVREESKWSRADGVHLGMDTNELQALNGKPFRFSGFGWDYGGGVGDVQGGRLARKDGSAGGIVLCEPEQVPEDYPAGDSEFVSDLPVLKAHPAHVCEFGVDVAPAN